MINLFKIHWFFRLLILSAMCSELIFQWPLNIGIGRDEPLRYAIKWAVQAILVWLIIYICNHSKTAIRYIQVGFACAFTTVIIGYCITYFFEIIFEFISSLKHKEKFELNDYSYPATLQFLKIICLVPFFLFVSFSFNPMSYFQKKLSMQSSRRGRLISWVNNLRPLRYFNAKKQFVLYKLAFGLRIFQKTAEVFYETFTIWKEENPKVFYPRFKGDLSENVTNRLKWIKWVVESIINWFGFLLAQALSVVPILQYELELLLSNKKPRQ